MCQIQTGGCGCSTSSSSGVSVRGIVMALVVAVSVVATYRILEVAWPLLLAVWAVAALYVWVPKARPGVRAAVVSPFLLAAWLWRKHRAARKAPSTAATAGASTALASTRAWEIVVYRPVGGTNKVITRGVVEGAWKTKAEVEAETMARAVAAYGYEQVADFRAHAQLVVTR